MSKNTKHTENATKNQGLASEIIAEQTAKAKRLEIAVIALSAVLLVSVATRKK